MFDGSHTSNKGHNNKNLNIPAVMQLAHTQKKEEEKKTR